MKRVSPVLACVAVIVLLPVLALAQSNMPEFYDAFGCEEGDGMVNPTNTRVTIW